MKSDKAVVEKLDEALSVAEMHLEISEGYLNKLNGLLMEAEFQARQP